MDGCGRVRDAQEDQRRHERSGGEGWVMNMIYRPPSGSDEWLVVSGECKIQMAAAKAPAGGIIVREGFRAQDPSATYHGGIAYPGGKFIPRVNSPKKKRP